MGCEMKPSFDIPKASVTKHSIIILNKSDTLLRVYYSDSMILSFKSMENNIIEETDFEYNSKNVLTGLTTKNLKYNYTTYKDFSYDSLKRISSINVLRVFENGDSIKERQLIDYNSTSKLIKINSFLPETFEYIGNNVTKNGKVNEEVAIWTDYVYSYDNMVNPVYNIGLPLINVKQISQNNIKSKLAAWIEFTDCILPNDVNFLPMNHIDTIYTSTFEYNEIKKPTIEYRKYKRGIDTLNYIYE